jgi:hypothetical protein
MPLTLLLFKGMTQKDDSPTVPPKGQRKKKRAKDQEEKEVKRAVIKQMTYNNLVINFLMPTSPHVSHKVVPLELKHRTIPLHPHAFLDSL